MKYAIANMSESINHKFLIPGKIYKVKEIQQYGVVLEADEMGESSYAWRHHHLSIIELSEIERLVFDLES